MVPAQRFHEEVVALLGPGLLLGSGGGGDGLDKHTVLRALALLVKLSPAGGREEVFDFARVGS